MSHDYHQGQPNYHPDQLLIDGCGECKLRSRDAVTALAHMNQPTWQRAWARALQYGSDGIDTASGAEIPLLALLWQLSIKFDSCGLPDALFDWLNVQARNRLRPMSTDPQTGAKVITAEDVRAQLPRLPR